MNMTVLKTYMKLLVKNSYAVLPYFVIFMVLAVLIGQSFGGDPTRTFQVTKMKVVISASSENMEADDFAAWLESRGHKVIHQTLTEKEAREEIFLERADATYLFPNEEKASPVVLADQKSSAGYYAGAMAEAFFRFREAYRLEDGSIDRASLFETLEQEMKVEVDVPDDDVDGLASGLSSVVASMSGAAYVLMAVSFGVLPLVHEAFTRPGIFERSIASPYRISKRVFELYLGSGIVVFVSAAVLFGLAQITLHRQVTAGQLGRLAVNYLVFALCVLAISNIISSLTRNRAAISAISTVFSLGLSFISGAFLPQELVSESVLRVSKAFPMFYFIRANRNSLAWKDMVPDILIQLVFFAMYFLIAVVLQRFAGRARKTIKTATSLASDIGV